MRGRFLVPTLVLAGALVCTTPAFANDTALGGIGGSVRPVESTNVRLDSEAVQAVVYSRFAEFRVDFRFVNEGPTQTVTLGFPFQRPQEGDYSPEAAFRAWQDGVPLQVTAVDGMDATEKAVFYTHKVTMRPGENMIAVAYLADPTESVATMYKGAPSRWAGLSSSACSYAYVLHTGRGWKGRITKSVVRVTFANDFLGWGLGQTDPDPFSHVVGHPFTWPLGFTRPDGHTLQWVFTDFEPEAVVNGVSRSDIRMGFYQPSWAGASASPPSKPPVVKVTASSHLKLDQQNDYSPDLVADGAPLTAWAEGVGGPGTGQWVRVDFGERRDVAEVRILPGYQKTAELFAKYDRPKTLTLAFSDGTTATVHLADQMGVQRFPVTAKASWAKVTIGEVYRGTTPDQTYISEVEFDAKPAPTFRTFTEVTGIAVTSRGGQTPTAAAATQAISSAAASAASAAAETAPRSMRVPAWVWAIMAAAVIVLGVAVGYLIWRRRPGAPPTV